MIEAWALWLLIVGLVTGGLVTWLVMVRLPRREDDVSAAERPAEAAWISRVIERHGGVAPSSLVEEVLDLHQAYLGDPRLAQMPVPSAPAGPPLPGGVPRQMPPMYPGPQGGIAPPPPAWPPPPGGPAGAPDARAVPPTVPTAPR